MSLFTTAQSDPLLLPYLQAQDEALAEQLLTQLIAEHVEPLVKNIVGYKLRVYFRGNANRTISRDAEDVFSEALLQFLTRLAEIKSPASDEAGIRNLRSYVAVIAYRACHLHLRRKYPQRYSLKNKLKYFLTHQQGFALWESEEEWLAGFADWQNQTPALETSPNQRLNELRDDAQTFITNLLPCATASNASLLELLTAIFQWTAAPIELDALVGVIAELWNIKDDTDKTESQDSRPAFENVADTRVSIARDFDNRLYLETLWGEIRQLSPRHCAALLLNLKDEQGNCAIDLFILTSVASFAELAAVLDKSTEWLAQIWNHLPIDDETIAKHLGLARQQVINLRKTARLRLARRLNELGF
jgi:DNA-directed RNA polymerase specialized sigma24 family protein